jgi:hypothetical protein
MTRRGWRKSGGAAAQRADGGGPAFEALEPRALLAAVAWTGAAGDNLWHTPANWSGNAVPGAADDVTIDVAGTPTIEFQIAAGIRSVNSLLARDNLRFTGGILTIGTSLTLQSGATFELAGSGTLNGGAWDVTGGTLRASGALPATLNGPQITGDLRVDGASAQVTLAGTTRFSALRLQGGNSRVNLANGFTLRDAIVAEGAAAGARQVAPSGITPTVNVAATGSIRLLAGAGAGLTIASGIGSLINAGIIRNEGGQVLTVQAASFTNQGVAETVAGGALNISSGTWSNPAGGLVSTVGGGTVTLSGNWSSPGTLALTGGTLQLNGNFATSSVNFAGIVRSGGTINFNGNWNNASAVFTLTPAIGPIVLQGGTITGGSIAFAEGANFVTTTGSTLLSSVAVLGDLIINSPNGALSVSGSTSFASVQLAGVNTRLALANGYTLAAPVLATGDVPGTRTVGGINPGSLLNLGPGGALRVAPGAGAGLTVVSSIATLHNTSGLIASEQPGQSLSITAALVSVGPGGTVLASGGNVVFSTGVQFSSSGTVLASAGLVNLSSALVSNLSGGASATLTGGRWEVVGTGGISTPAASTIVANAAEVLIDGTGTAWDALFWTNPGPLFNKVTSLSSNAGTLAVGQAVRLIRNGAFSSTGRLELGPTALLSVTGSVELAESGTLAVAAQSTGGPVSIGQISAGTIAYAGGFELAYSGPDLPQGSVVPFLLAPSIGGGFSSMAYPPAMLTGRLIVDPASYSPPGTLALWVSDRRDITNDGQVNLDDLGDFITLYYAYVNTPAPWPGDADWNRDLNLNLDDLGDYITEFYS